MEMSLILLILGFVVVTYLIFKFIKKIVVAIFSFIFLIILIIGSVIGLAVLDVNNLSSQSDFNVNLIYGNQENALFGLTIPIVNKTFEKDKVSSYNVGQINLNNLEKTNDFDVFYSKKLLESQLDEKNSYYLIGTENLTIMGIDVETKLNKEQVLTLLNSSNALDDYVLIVIAENQIPDMLKSTAETAFKTKIKEELDSRNLTFRDALFVSVLLDIVQGDFDEKKISTFLKAYKNGDLEILPERFTFKLIRILPLNLILDYISKLN